MALKLRLPPSVEDRLLTLDRVGDRALDGVRGRPGMDTTFYTASALADHSVLWHAIGAVRALQGERQLREAVRLSGSLAAESALVNLGVKSLFSRSRPAFVGERPLALRRPKTSSFPSGHSSAAFCAAVLLADGSSRRTAPLWYGAATVVSLSRAYVRIHHLSDVAVGAVVGIALGHVAKRLVPIDRPAAPAEAAPAP